MKLVTAFQSSFDESRISLSEEEIVKYDLTVERKNKVTDYLAKNLAISKEDDLKATIVSFLVSDNVFFELWGIFDMTSYENYLKEKQDTAAKLGMGTGLTNTVNAKEVTQQMPNLEKVY